MLTVKVENIKKKITPPSNCTEALKGKETVPFDPHEFDKERSTICYTLILFLFFSSFAKKSFLPFPPLSLRDVLYKGYNPDLNCYISIFYDKFVKSPTRYASVGGLYMSVMSQKLRDQKKLENVMLLSLIPGDVNFTNIWEIFRREIQDLQVSFPLPLLDSWSLTLKSQLPLLILDDRLQIFSPSLRKGVALLGVFGLIQG